MASRWLDEEEMEILTSDTDILQTTLRIYGTIFLVLLGLFSVSRRYFPRVYNLRNWVDGIKTDIAKDQFGFISWIWKVFGFTDDQMLDECGMDGVCFVRVLGFGLKLSIVGMLNAIWLMPMYSQGGDEVEDAITTVTVANIPSGSNVLIGTVVAAWIIFGACIYFVLVEFEFFTKSRHLFLAKPFPRNYSVYIRNVPKEYLEKSKFVDFFNKAYQDSVLEGNIAVQCPNLKAKVEEREKVLSNLEHAINKEKYTGISPEKTSGCIPRKSEGSLIDSLNEELDQLNKEILDSIKMIESKQNGSKSTSTLSTDLKNETSSLLGAARTMLSKEDGDYFNAGFVTFKSLHSKNAALQMTQLSKPFEMEVVEAPQPEDINWQNVGKSHKELQLGKLLSNALTVTLCLLWTIPMSFISALSSIEGLKTEFEFVGTMIDNAPWLEPVLAQLAPLLIVVAKKLVEILCVLFSARELPISGADLQASVYPKMAWFMIIQTFFVSAVSGSILSELSNMVEQPGLIVDLLASSLPSQSMYFIQIMLVDSSITLGIELLRVSAVAVAIIRSKIGPNLTEKESNTTWMGLRPLADPEPFRHYFVFSNVVLYFMVFFVYATIAPLTTFIVGICFFFMSASYRHQFIYIYPTFPDSGGKLWINFFSILPFIMIIAELTLVGMIALKKSPIASAMMLPLLIVTILFSIYIKQKHFEVAAFLPALDAIVSDEKNLVDGVDLQFLQSKYLQPELREKGKAPSNTSDESSKVEILAA